MDKRILLVEPPFWRLSKDAYSKGRFIMQSLHSSSAQSTYSNSHHGGSTRLATIFLTSDCNLNCPYCYALENVFSPNWDMPRFISLFDYLAQENYNVSLGGGEPLTHPELVLDVAKHAAQRHMGFSLLTNGYLLDFDLLKRLKRAGVNWIQISADSAGEIERFAPLLEEGHRLGLRMAVGTVLLGKRLGEVGAMHNILTACSAVGWRILRYTPLNEGPLTQSAPTNDEWIDMLFRVENTLHPDLGTVQIRYEPSVVPLEWLQRQPLTERLDVCGGRRARRLFVYPDGEIFSCGLPRRKGIDLGNFMSDFNAFEDALTEVPTSNFVSREHAESYCRDMCLGGCVQLRGDQPCDPRCDLDAGLVPVCCFEKLQLSGGQQQQGNMIFPSELYRNYKAKGKS